VRGQVFVPAEILRGMERSMMILPLGVPRCRSRALADLRATARAHLDTFDARLHSLPEKSRPAFYLFAFASPICG